MSGGLSFVAGRAGRSPRRFAAIARRRRVKLTACRRLSRCVAPGAALLVLLWPSLAGSQVTASSLSQLRGYGASVNNETVVLDPLGGDPHPVTGVVTPGVYWLNGDHITDPTGTTPYFLNLGGSGNTYNLSGATLKVDTREFDGYGRALGHGSTVHVVQLQGSGNTLQGLTLIGEDLELDTDPNAQRYADWGTQYVKLTGSGNSLDGASVVTRGSRTDTYGLSDAFGKGASQGMQPYIGHRKAAGIFVDDANDTLVTNLDLTIKTFGHGFFTGSNVSNTTLSNATITGELFPSQMVIDRPEYQQYGHTWWGYPIQDDIMLSGAEGGVRTYGGTNLTVDNVVVDGMRTGFATVATAGDVNINNSFAYNTTSGFDVGDNTTITGSGGNIVNGPLLVFYYGNAGDSEIELDIQGGAPIGVDWSAIYMNGDNVDLTLTSSLSAGDLPQRSYIRLGQKYFENWRDSDFNTASPEGNNPIPLTNSTFTNNTNQILVLGENAVGNTGSSQAPVITNGKENHYDGVTLVPDGWHIVLQHRAGLGNNGTAADGSLDANASRVESGGTLELNPGVRIADEKLTISGFGSALTGALYSAGGIGGNAPRFGSADSGDESTIVLNGDAAIGVGVAGRELLVGKIQGLGNLIKLGAGTLSVQVSTAFDGDLVIGEGVVEGRSGVAFGTIRNTGGTFVAGDAIGSASIVGDLHQSAGGTLRVELGGAGGLGGVDHDHIAVTGTFEQGGTFEAVLVGGFVPGFGDAFNMIDAAAFSGGYDQVLLPALSTGLLWETSRLESEGVLSVGTDRTRFSLIYEPATGELSIDTEGETLINYVLEGSGFVEQNHLRILGGVGSSTDGVLSESAFAPVSGLRSLGQVLPAGLTESQFESFLTKTMFVSALGEPVLPFDLLYAGTLPGDTDGDGDIDDVDLGTSFANYTGPGGGDKTAADGDTDGDGDVDDGDLGASFAGYTGPLDAAAAVNVPEPGVLTLVCLAGSALLTRRRGSRPGVRVVEAACPTARGSDLLMRRANGVADGGHR